MKIQLITIGNELLNGKVQDRNAYWLAGFCHEHHIDFTKNHIIPDEKEAFFSSLSQAWEESDLVITSGGLGPTKDDLTKELLSDYFKRPIVESDKAMECAVKNYSKSKREYDPKLGYSQVPEGFEALNNRVGYAPGLLLNQDKKILVALPGVPSEFKAMFTEEVLPLTKNHFNQPTTYRKHVIIKTWKAPESLIFNSIAPKLWDDLSSFGEVSSLPNPMGVDIGVKIEADSQKALEAKESDVRKCVLNSPLKENIWHIGPESIEEVIVKMAIEKNIKIGFAESCTGGLCASRITDVAGSSAVFMGSIVAYHNEVKENVLNVNKNTLVKYGAVSSETAWEMAQGARFALNADLVVTTTGVAGPGGGSKEKPVGTIGLGYSSERDCAGDLHHLPAKDRTDMKLVFSQLALMKMLEQIVLY